LVDAERDLHDAPFFLFEQRSWTALAVLSAGVILAKDGPQNCVVWLLVMCLIIAVVMPRLYRWGHAYLNRSKNMYLGVIIGWALVPGPLVGILFGTICPAVLDCGISSLFGGVIGLAVGPCFAVIEGLTIVCLVDGIYWLLTGHRFGGTAA
jgi:hypothetical protein